MIPDRMTAVHLTGHGGLDRLVLRDDVAVPRPGAGEVLVLSISQSTSDFD